MRITDRHKSIKWDELRVYRNNELEETDWWAVKDLSMSQAKKDYRKFLRDITENYDTADEAWDAWFDYDLDMSWFD
tara:strand:+ start:1059 stop:1286 length:228 start_codon:yes stop_codon:yes gene_type:complete